MQLSVIIVNYNVRYFLEQALFAVRKASEGLYVEVFVVDNNSSDGSAEMVIEKFPEVKFIQNTVNAGFSKANNQAILQSSGKYVLLLNPDTVVEEDTFHQVINFMEQTPNCGALGVKMIDGTGRFLPESKRALPTPAVAFYKTFGLAALFPKSKTFGRYHLAYLDKDKVHEVEVLSGAFMLLRKEALDKAGLLDEDFFMYGEDIDLSYRIIKAGYKNFYFPLTRIIHYKGESTKKTSINYVFVFYNAMIIFARKHFSQKNARLFSMLINVAVYLRAGISITRRFVIGMFLPVIDFVVAFVGMFTIKTLWEKYVIESKDYYPDTFLQLAVPLYIVSWLTGIYLSNGYEKPYKPLKIIKGILYGTVAILVLYGLVPESYRFSRAIIFIGSSYALLALVLVRMIFGWLGLKSFSLELKKKKRVIIVGAEEEGNRVLSLLRLSGVDFHFSGFVKSKNGQGDNYIGQLQDLQELIRFHFIDEVIFCAKDVPSTDIIENMSLLSQYAVEYKIAPPESLYIIGSNSIHNNGELYVIDINSIGKPSNKRNKRIFDLVTASGMLILFPVTLLLVKQKRNYARNIFNVLKGSHTWVGYAETTKEEMYRLPKLKDSVLTPIHVARINSSDTNTVSRLNALYAKDYKIWNDVHIVWKAFSELGGK